MRKEAGTPGGNGGTDGHATGPGPDGPGPEAARRGRAWRDRRTETVTGPYGPLSLTGTHWLADHPGGRIPSLPGEWRDDGDAVLLTAGHGDGLTVDGSVPDRPVRLGADHGPVPGSRVAYGRRRLVVLSREGQWAVRDFDPDAPARAAFAGVETGPYDPAWVLPGHYRPYPEHLGVRVANADGRERGLGLDGELTLRHPSGELVLRVAVETGGGLWAVFTDATAGDTGYRFRFLRTPPPAPDGTVTADLNRVTLPPCAFADHFICPFPPPGNSLSVAVEAGELRLAGG
jgi:uncharacterized protein